MKRGLLFLSGLIILSLTGFGQAITLTDGDIASVGASFDQRTDTLLSLTPGSGGASAVWDFQTLTSGSGLSKTITAVNPSTLPLGYRFVAVGANIAMTENDTLTNYFFKKTVEGAVIVGYTFDFIGNGDTVCIIFSSPDTMISLPSTFNTAFHCNSFADTKSRIHATIDTMSVTVPVDSVRIKHSGDKYSVVDGWGTLTLPNGSVPALRQNIWEKTVDSVWAFINFPPFFTGWYPYQSFSSTNTQYIWWSHYTGMALVKMDYDSTLSAVTDITWLYVTNLGIQPYAQASDLLYYPNPAGDRINIEADNNYQTVQLFDLAGKEVTRKINISEPNFSIGTNDLDNGVYFMRLTTNNQSPVIRKFIVQH